MTTWRNQKKIEIKIKKKKENPVISYCKLRKRCNNDSDRDCIQMQYKQLTQYKIHTERWNMKNAIEHRKYKNFLILNICRWLKLANRLSSILVVVVVTTIVVTSGFVVAPPVHACCVTSCWRVGRVYLLEFIDLDICCPFFRYRYTHIILLYNSLMAEYVTALYRFLAFRFLLRFLHILLDFDSIFILDLFGYIGFSQGFSLWVIYYGWVGKSRR